MCKILIVEDNAMFRQSFRKVLSSCFPSCTIDEVMDGSEVLAKVESFRPDLIFMDIRLPGENGIKLTQRVHTSYPEILVVVHTSYDLPEYRDAAMQAGAERFITKGSLAEKQIKKLVQSLLPDKFPPDSD